MNKQQQQNTMLKLATVRLAINHVLRSRAMQKKAYTGQPVPGYGHFAERTDNGYNAPAPYLPEIPFLKSKDNPYGEDFTTTQDPTVTVGPRGNEDHFRWNWTWDGREDEIDPGKLAVLKRKADPFSKTTKFGPSAGNIQDYNKALAENLGDFVRPYQQLYDRLYEQKAKTPEQQEQDDLRGDFGF